MKKGQENKEATLQKKEVKANAAQNSSTKELPAQLKSGVEALSGVDMADTTVHRNSSLPAQFKAHAFAQGSDIHLASGQEQHLPHEAWHVVQQKQGRVEPTKQLKGKTNVNDDPALEKEADVMGAKALNYQSEKPTQLKSKETSNNTPYQFHQPEKLEMAERVAEDAPAKADPVAEVVDDATVEQEPEAQKDKEEGPLATDKGLAINPEATKEEKELVAEHGDRFVENASAGAAVASSVGSAAYTIHSANQPAVEGATLMDRTQKVFQKSTSNVSFSGVLSKIFGLASPLVSGIQSILGAKSKLSQWTQFEKAAVDPQTKKPKKGAPPEAKYGLTKVWKGFARMVKNVFMAISNFTANLLMLIPGAQIVAGPWKIFNMVVGIVDSLYKGGKRLYQFFKGEKKESNAKSLLDKALGDDTESLELILGLQLGSIAGTGYETLDALGWAGEEVKNYAKRKMGLTEDGADRIVDLFGGVKGPQNTEDLHKWLNIICEKQDSKDLILGELREAMTGYGT